MAVGSVAVPRVWPLYGHGRGSVCTTNSYVYIHIFVIITERIFALQFACLLCVNPFYRRSFIHAIVRHCSLCRHWRQYTRHRKCRYGQRCILPYHISKYLPIFSNSFLCRNQTTMSSITTEQTNSAFIKPLTNRNDNIQ